VLTDPRWRAAVIQTPRHLLVPQWLVQGEDAAWRSVSRDDPDTATEWADGVYRNTPLVTALDDDQEPSSSSSQPSLMIRMLDALDLHDHHRVLEIGTGTGYNAALLAHRLTDSQVHTVDLDPQLTEPARQHLAALGIHPRIEARDGATGWAEHAPYDRIIATCSVPRVPPAWAAQTTRDGLVLADLKIGGSAGTLALLRRGPDGLAGQFLPKWAGFMPIRQPANTPLRAPAPAGDTSNESEVIEREVAVGELAQPLGPVEEFLAALELPGNRLRRVMILDPSIRTPIADRYTTGDGSWCEIERAAADSHRGRRVRTAGPTPLLEILLSSHDLWSSSGEPGWDRFALAVDPDNRHHIHLDPATSQARTWTLSSGVT
jgi:protein-L-isoaspartate O-methyltransferase